MFINHLKLSEVDPSAEKPYSMRPVHFLSLYETGNVESLTLEIYSACFVSDCRALETVLGLARTLLAWLSKLLGQKHAMQRLHADWKLEVSELAEIKDEDEGMIVFGSLDRSSSIDGSRWSSFYSFRGAAYSLVCSDPGTLCHHPAA